MTVLNIFLLDRTGSMDSIKASTIESFNGYIAAQQNSDIADEILFSLITFDSISTDTVYSRAKINDVKPLDNYTFQPRGATPLIDACCSTILAVDRWAAETTAAKIAVTFMTDGEENASRKWKLPDLHLMIKERVAAGWQINFMGAGIDAYQAASAMGIGAAATMSYDKGDIVASRAAFAASAQNMRAWVRGDAVKMEFTDEQKSQAGDAFHKPVDAAKKTKGLVDDITL